MDFNTDLSRVKEFIFATFHDTMKPAGGIFRFPYVSPGAFYSRMLWDWDSYWTLLAVLKMSKKENNQEFLTELTDYACGTFFNFLDHQGADGALPICLKDDDPDPFDCLASPDNNMAKPFIAQTGKLLLDFKMLTKDDLLECIDHLYAYHDCYFKRYLDEKTGLVFWAKDWGIGIDDEPTTWGRPEKSCASIFLNSFLYRDCLAGAELADFCGKTEYAAQYRKWAEQLAAAIEKYCWDEREKSYFSVDIQCRPNIAQTRCWGRINKNLDTFWHCLKQKTLLWSCILPFWCGLGTDEQFESFVRENLTSDRLRSDYGIRSLSKDESMYKPEAARGNPSNWLGPIWIVANYIVWETLRQRGYTAEADQLAKDVIGMLAQDLEASGTFHEYYSPETGLGVNNPNFMSWNALAGLMKVSKA